MPICSRFSNGARKRLRRGRRKPGLSQLSREAGANITTRGDRKGRRKKLKPSDSAWLRQIASHSKEQDFYFGDDFLLRRYDYHVDVAGGFATAQYVHDIVEVEGLSYPTKRFAYVRGPKAETDSRSSAGLDRPQMMPIEIGMVLV
jgi:transposase